MFLKPDLNNIFPVLFDIDSYIIIYISDSFQFLDTIDSKFSLKIDLIDMDKLNELKNANGQIENPSTINQTEIILPIETIIVFKDFNYFNYFNYNVLLISIFNIDFSLKYIKKLIFLIQFFSIISYYVDCFNLYLML